MPKAVVVGVDGFDPTLVENLIQKGKLPHCKALQERGAFRRLQTTNPAQSPVAWASLATGVNPGEHGLFDFIMRDPNTHLPVLALNKPNKRNIMGRRERMYLPVTKAAPFWHHLDNAGIPTRVIKWPVQFPSQKLKHGRALAGLGVPDLRGTLGRYTLFTTQPKTASDQKGEVITLTDQPKNEVQLPGPEQSSAPISIHRQVDHTTITIQEATVPLKPEQWTDWIRVQFKHGLRTLSGLVRFYQVAGATIQIYATAIHVDPKAPAFPISEPDEYAKTLADDIGNYHTLGLPEETNGVVDNVLPLAACDALIDSLEQEREAMLWHELTQFKEGLLAVVVDGIDRMQHMHWAGTDTEHPLYRKDDAHDAEATIAAQYKRVDKMIGRIAENIDDQTLLLVVSDHGFSSFRRAVHLNRWLVNEGFMTLKTANSESLFATVDWTRTKAYAVGFASIYFNVQGREKNGIVKPGTEVHTLSAILCDRLSQLQDTDGTSVVHKVYESAHIYKGEQLTNAPDIVYGLQPGYRASWQTAIGAVPETTIEDNTKAWTGDHLIDPSFVPGTLLMNKPTNTANPNVYDIAPTIHAFFNTEEQKTDGKSLL